MAEPGEKPTCFIAMPITTQPEHVERYGGDEDHWGHVMGSLFEKSIEAAGFQPIRPAAQGSDLIHGLIIRHLSTADLVLVDLSTHNPNVFFELGVRTSLNLPIALVRDEHTKIPFDTSGINTHAYDSNLRGWEIEQQQRSLARHIEESHKSCEGQNPLWRQFGLTIKASEPDANESPLEAKVDLLMGQFVRLQDRLQNDRAITREEVLWAMEDSARLQQPRVGESLSETPADLFTAAVIRELAKRGDGTLRSIDTIGPAAVDLHFDATVSPSTLIRILGLAGHYMVRVGLRYGAGRMVKLPSSEGPVSTDEGGTDPTVAEE